MVRFIICAFIVNLSWVSLCQEDLAIVKEQQIAEMRVDKNFNRKYKRQLELLRRTYPMALKAKELIDEYERDLQDYDKKRKKKKYGKEAHQKLKDEFTYNIRDLYETEGDLLMKLVYRETGLTVNEIIKKYRGGFQTSLYSGMAKIWGHDLNDTYNPKGDDWITEVVIQDIIAGNISFDTSMRRMDKASFKEGMKEYRDGRKKSKKDMKKRKKDNRKSSKKGKS